MNIEVSEEEARAIERRRARLAAQTQPRRTSRLGWVLNIIMTLAIGLIALVGGGLLYFGYVEPRLSHGSAAVQPTAAPVATEGRPSRQEILRTSVEDNQVAQPTTVLAVAPLATVARQQAPGGVRQPTVVPAPAVGQTAVTIDHLSVYPPPTSVLSQAEQEAAAASDEQMMLDRACQGLTEAQCSAQAGEAGNNIRIALWPTPTQEP